MSASGADDPVAPRPHRRRAGPALAALVVVAAVIVTVLVRAGRGHDGCGMNFVRPLDPPGEQHHTVCWVQHDFGFAPGTDGRGTTYVAGHSWGQDSREVLNAISERATRQVLGRIAAGRARSVPALPGSGQQSVAVYPVTALTGDVLSLATPNGTLRYSVDNVYAVAKSQAGWVRSLMDEHTKHRVLVITCAELNHVDYAYNIIVEARLTSSKARAATT